MELAWLEEKAQGHECLFDSREKEVLKRLCKKFRSNGDGDSAGKVTRLLQDAEDVEERIETARTEGGASLGKVIAKIEKLAKKRGKLLSKAPFKKKYTKIREEREEVWRQQEQVWRQQEQEARRRKENEEARRQEEASYRERRAKQLKVAGNPAASNMKFAALRFSEHAVRRWKDRGLDSMTFEDLLLKLDDARIIYTLEPSVGDKGEDAWEVKLQRLEGKKRLVLILDDAKTTIITVLRDDSKYDYKKNDTSFAPAGRVAAERCLT